MTTYPVLFCGRDDLAPHLPHHWRRRDDGTYGDYDDGGILVKCPGQPGAFIDDEWRIADDRQPRQGLPCWTYQAVFLAGCLTGLALRRWRR